MNCLKYVENHTDVIHHKRQKQTETLLTRSICICADFGCSVHGRRWWLPLHDLNVLYKAFSLLTFCLFSPCTLMPLHQTHWSGWLDSEGLSHTGHEICQVKCVFPHLVDEWELTVARWNQSQRGVSPETSSWLLYLHANCRKPLYFAWKMQTCKHLPTIH